jgi:hypothetical protein
VVVFNTLYLQDVLDALRSEGHPVTDEAAAHLSPALLDHISPYGSYTFEHRTRTPTRRQTTPPPSPSSSLTAPLLREPP